MSGIWDKIKSHPYIVGSFIAVVMLFVLLRSRGSASNGQVAVVGTSQATDNTLAIAQLQAQSQSDLISAQSAASAAHDDASLQVAQLQAALGAQQVDASKTVDLASIDAQTQQTAISADVAKAQLQTQLSLAGLTQATQQSYITSAADIQQQQITANTNNQVASNQTLLDLASILHPSTASAGSQIYADASSGNIQQLYQDVDGRAADASGLSYWEQQVGKVSTSDLLKGFVSASVANHENVNPAALQYQN